MARAWGIVLGMSTMIVAASVVGVVRTNGDDSTHINTLVYGTVVLATALWAFRKRPEP